MKASSNAQQHHSIQQNFCQGVTQFPNRPLQPHDHSLNVARSVQAQAQATIADQKTKDSAPGSRLTHQSVQNEGLMGLTQKEITTQQISRAQVKEAFSDRVTSRDSQLAGSESKEDQNLGAGSETLAESTQGTAQDAQASILQINDIAKNGQESSLTDQVPFIIERASDEGVDFQTYQDDKYAEGMVGSPSNHGLTFDYVSQHLKK
mmetsp:Transcript_9303/g.15678  ORF Transcript_9303/g.15678 Transcript_9303/m.15678 type:complete len:206 (-) Transcript_9303:1364-1981(-)